MIIKMKKYIINNYINEKHINIEGKRCLSWLKLYKQSTLIYNVLIKERRFVLL